MNHAQKCHQSAGHDDTVISKSALDITQYFKSTADAQAPPSWAGNQSFMTERRVEEINFTFYEKILQGPLDLPADKTFSSPLAIAR